MGVRKRNSADLRKAEQKNIAFAKLLNIPTSPRKMRLVADMIRGVEVNRALGILKFSSSTRVLCTATLCANSRRSAKL